MLTAPFIKQHRFQKGHFFVHGYFVQTDIEYCSYQLIIITVYITFQGVFWMEAVTHKYKSIHIILNCSNLKKAIKPYDLPVLSLVILNPFFNFPQNIIHLNRTR